MATGDGNDRRGDGGDGGGGGDWWTQNAPPPAPLKGVIGGPIPTNPDGSQVGGGTSWAPGSNAPSTAPPGYHWDPVLFMFQPDAPVKTPDPVNPNPGPAPPPGVTTQPIGVPTTGFGAAPAPYASNPNAPTYTPMPTYVPPTWTGGDFKNPTLEDLQAMPGYQVGLEGGLQARNRAAAAQGTVLNGGTLKALARYGTDYNNTNYQTLRNNSFEAYKQRYQQFTDAAGMDLAARTANANENQNTFTNNTNSYLQGNTRTLSDYLTNLTAKRNSEMDYWGRLQDLNQTGASLAGGSYRP